MAINKIFYGNNLLINLENDTVEASDVVAGVTFHTRSGEQAVGTLDIQSILDRLSELEQKLADYETQDSFECTRSSSVSGGAAYGTFDRMTKKVTIVGWWNNSSTLSSSTTLFTVPADYRPSERAYGMAGIRTTTQANNPRPYNMTVDTNGAISQTLGNAVYAGSFVVEYFI